MTHPWNESHPHIAFKRQWDEVNSQLNRLLGEVVQPIETVGRIAVLPEDAERFYRLALVKGVQGTLAIEGNTMTSKQIEEVLVENKSMPESRDYQVQEVRNIAEAFSTIAWGEVVESGKAAYLTPQLLLSFHKMVGKDVGETFEAIPGHFTERDRNVGKYRCPAPEHVPLMVAELCDWLRKEFGWTPEHPLPLDRAIILAIVAHVYIEWIHPFSDGNGRTGRLLEFYLLVRAGLPLPCTLLLSNHYNQTRERYALELFKAGQTRSLTEFIIYALQGFRDGLVEQRNELFKCQMHIVWREYIYKTFERGDGEKPSAAKVRRRRRTLTLNLEPEKTYKSIEALIMTSSETAFAFGNLGQKTIQRDVDALVELELLVKDKTGYRSNVGLLRHYLPPRRNHPKE